MANSASAEGLGVKQRILRAAMTEFALTGFHQTSLRTIAARSGSNKPMIYYHFQSKDGLYLAAVRALLEEMAGHLDERAPAGSEAPDRLRRFAEVYLDAFLLSRPMLGAALRELEGLPSPLYHAIVDEYRRLIASQLRHILTDGVEAGQFRGLDLDGCVSGVTAILHHFVRTGRTAPQRAIVAGLSQLMDYYVRGLLSAAVLQDTIDREREAPLNPPVPGSLRPSSPAVIAPAGA